GDLLDMHIALSPCLVGYAEVAQFLLQDANTVRDGNPYNAWIAMYASDEFQPPARAEVEWLHVPRAQISNARFDQLATSLRDATRLEIDFWQMGLDRSS